MKKFSLSYVLKSGARLVVCLLFFIFLCVGIALAGLRWLGRDVSALSVEKVVSELRWSGLQTAISSGFTLKENTFYWLAEQGDGFHRMLVAAVFARGLVMDSVPMNQAWAPTMDRWPLPDKVVEELKKENTDSWVNVSQGCQQDGRRDDVVIAMKLGEGFAPQDGTKVGLGGEGAVPGALKWFYMADPYYGAGLREPASRWEVPRMTTLRASKSWEELRDEIVLSDVSCAHTGKALPTVEESLEWLQVPELKTWLLTEGKEQAGAGDVEVPYLGLNKGTLSKVQNADNETELGLEFKLIDKQEARALFSRWQRLPYPRESLSAAYHELKQSRFSASETLRLEGWTLLVLFSDKIEGNTPETVVQLKWTKSRPPPPKEPVRPPQVQQQTPASDSLVESGPVEMAGPGIR